MTQPSLLDQPAETMTASALPDRLLLLRYFQQHQMEWIPLPELARGAGISPYSVTARVRDLRKTRYGGHRIPNRQVRVGGVCHSSYRYEP